MQPPAPPAARALRASPHLTHCKSQMSKPGREHDDSQENGKRPALSCFRAGYAVGGPVDAEGEVGSLLWLLAVPQTLRGPSKPASSFGEQGYTSAALPPPPTDPALSAPSAGMWAPPRKPAPLSPPLSSLFSLPCSFHSLPQLAFRWDTGGHFLFFFPNNSRSLL